MKDSYVPAAAMIVGLIMMFVGYWQEALMPQLAPWTNEQAVEYQRTSQSMHKAAYSGHDHSKEGAHSEPDRKSPEYLKAKEEFEKSKADLAAALTRQAWMKYGIILTGVAIAGYGIVCVAIDKMRADEASTLKRSGR